LLFIKSASGFVALERPEAQAWKLALRNCEQRGANTAALRRLQHLELINPPFTKCNDTDQLLVVEIAPELTGREHALSEERPIRFGV
jgi:hypothetical protein